MNRNGSELIWSFSTNVWEQCLAKRATSRYSLTRRYRDPILSSTRLTSDLVEAVPKYFILPTRWSDRLVNYSLTTSTFLVSLIAAEVVSDFCDPPVVLVDRVLAAYQELHDRVAPSSAAESLPCNNVHLNRLCGCLTNPQSARVDAVRRWFPRSVISDISRLINSIEAVSDNPCGRVCHGNASAGNIFVNLQTGEFEIPFGPEVVNAPIELDIGWLLGDVFEIISLQQISRGEQLDQVAAYDDIIVSRSRRSNLQFDIELCYRFAIARFVLHILDFVNTTSAISAARARVNAFCELLKL